MRRRRGAFAACCALLGLSAVPYGGIWDRRADEFLGVDGVNESVVYSLVAGSRAGEAGDSSFE